MSYINLGNERFSAKNSGFLLSLCKLYIGNRFLTTLCRIRRTCMDYTFTPINARSSHKKRTGLFETCSFHHFCLFLYSVGVFPVHCLNLFVKCSGSLNPTIRLISWMSKSSFDSKDCALIILSFKT